MIHFKFVYTCKGLQILTFTGDSYNWILRGFKVISEESRIHAIHSRCRAFGSGTLTSLLDPSQLRLDPDLPQLNALAKEGHLQLLNGKMKGKIVKMKIFI